MVINSNARAHNTWTFYYNGFTECERLPVELVENIVGTDV